MELSIIIVNWNSADYVRKCLASIYSNLRSLDFEIIVVDNASFDNCKDIVLQHYPEVKFIQSHENIGFARANNLGYSHASGNSLLFLNPDTEIVGSSINIMHNVIGEIPNAGAIGCKLCNANGSIQSSSIQSFPTLLNQIFGIELLREKMPLLKLWGIKALYETSSTPVPVDVVSGACTLVKRTVFESIKYFSTDYFMYAEDVDLCYKIKKSGYEVYYTGAATVIHHGSGSSSQRDRGYFAALVMRESVKKFMHKSRGRLYGELYRILTGVAAICRIIIISLLLIPAIASPARERLKISRGKWIKILRWSLGLEKWTRNLADKIPFS